MSTDIRPEISSRNPYSIEKEKYYELKHFCLQYPSWRKERTRLINQSRDYQLKEHVSHSDIANPTEAIAMKLTELSDKMSLVENTAKEADGEIGQYILLVVTGVATYQYLKTRMQIPFSRDAFYEVYRRFFWLLAQKR